MTHTESVEMAESTLLRSLALLLEHGAEVPLSKREMEIFELGAYLGQVATIEYLEEAETAKA